ncbi:MAG TPA: hypothetical protein VGU46_00575 [Acidobacteriaceae bacterium]|nr:hypothetical protein [Acidobacteriaceae bacterium]
MPEPLKPSPRWTARELRRDITARAEHLARTQALLYDTSPGADPAVLFGREEAEPGQPARHGNFHPAAYAGICANPAWLRRLGKPHTASRRSRARKDWQWMELDSAVSSDALLMNIFCHPQVFDGNCLAQPIAALLNVDPGAAPCFGARPGVPLKPSTAARTSRKKTASTESTHPVDRTEIDLTLSTASATLFLEAKLTESDFQTAAPALIDRYRDLDAVFDPARLPRRVLLPPPLPPNVDPDDPTVNLPPRPTRIRIGGYQLIRNVLAAYSADASFCVLVDGRRYDLIESWFTVLSAVRSASFATRLKLLTWQELAGTLPDDLQHFLAEKYGI